MTVNVCFKTTYNYCRVADTDLGVSVYFRNEQENACPFDNLLK